MAIRRKCRICGTDKVVPCTDEQYREWKGGKLIQNAMPNISRDDRELLMSGICGPCFDKLMVYPDK
jgi:hypothetical protein